MNNLYEVKEMAVRLGERESAWEKRHHGTTNKRGAVKKRG